MSKIAFFSSLTLLGLLISSTTYAQLPQNGLVSHWKMEGTNQPTMIDEMGINDGTYVNGPIQAPGVNAGAMYFDGVNDYAIVMDNPSLDFGSNDFSVSYWFNKQATTSNWDNCEAVGKWINGAHGPVNEWALGICGGGNREGVGFSIQSGASTITLWGPGGSIPLLNTWNHIVGVREGVDLKIYLNGSLIATRNIGDIAINNVGRNLNIARSEQTSNHRNSNVILDDIAIYSRALTPDEIMGVYVGPHCTGDQGLQDSAKTLIDTIDNIVTIPGNSPKEKLDALIDAIINPPNNGKGQNLENFLDSAFGNK